MLDVEKVRLMCQLASFEEKEGKDVFEISRYYKSDYISKKLFAAVVHYTICFLLLLLLAAGIRMNDVFSLLSLSFLKNTGRIVLALYLAGMAVAAIASCLSSAERYDRAHRQVLFYTAKLNKLLKLDEGGAPEPPETLIASKHSVYSGVQRTSGVMQRGQSRGKRSRRLVR